MPVWSSVSVRSPPSRGPHRPWVCTGIARINPVGISTSTKTGAYRASVGTKRRVGTRVTTRRAITYTRPLFHGLLTHPGDSLYARISPPSPSVNLGFPRPSDRGPRGCVDTPVQLLLVAGDRPPVPDVLRDPLPPEGSGVPWVVVLP